MRAVHLHPPIIPEHRHHISQEPHTHKFQPPDPTIAGGSIPSQQTYTPVYETVYASTTETAAAAANIGNEIIDVFDLSGNKVYDGMTEYAGVATTSPPLNATDNLPPCIAFIYIIKAV